MGAMRRRGQHEGDRKSPIDSSSRPQWAARRMAACVGAMRAAKRDACKTAAMNAGEMAGSAGRGGHKRDDRGGAHAASRPGPRRMAQGPFGHAACRMPLPHGAKPVRPDRRPLPRKGRAALAASSRHAWFRAPRRERGPLAARFARHASRIARLRPGMDAWGGDVAILISKSMHFGRMLPGRGPFSRIRLKGDACGAILASQDPGAAATRGERWGG